MKNPTACSPITTHAMPTTVRHSRLVRALLTRCQSDGWLAPVVIAFISLSRIRSAPSAASGARLRGGRPKRLAPPQFRDRSLGGGHRRAGGPWVLPDDVVARRQAAEDRRQHRSGVRAAFV